MSARAFFPGLGSSYGAPSRPAICGKSAHAFENNCGQLHDLLIQHRVFLNFALDAIAVGMQLLSQRLELADEILYLLRRRLRYAAHQYAKIVGRRLAIANIGLTGGVDSGLQFVVFAPALSSVDLRSSAVSVCLTALMARTLLIKPRPRPFSKAIFDSPL